MPQFLPFFFSFNLSVTLKLGAVIVAACRARLPIPARNKHRFISTTKQALERRQKDFPSLLCTHTHTLSLLQSNLTLRRLCTVACSCTAGPAGRHVASLPFPPQPRRQTLAWHAGFYRGRLSRPCGWAKICASLARGLSQEVIQPRCC